MLFWGIISVVSDGSFVLYVHKKRKILMQITVDFLHKRS